VKKRAATLLLLTYCLLLIGGIYHFHPQEPQAALHCKVCAVSQAIILPAATNLECDVNLSERLITVPFRLGNHDHVSLDSGRFPPTA
jgi:hypothetical protein